MLKVKLIFCYVFWIPPKGGGWLPTESEPTSDHPGNFQPHPLTSVRAEGLDVRSITNH